MFSYIRSVIKNMSLYREARSFGFRINPFTGTWSGSCNVCGKHAVLVESCYCQSCIDDFQRERQQAQEEEATGHNAMLEDYYEDCLQDERSYS